MLRTGIPDQNLPGVSSVAGLAWRVFAALLMGSLPFSGQGQIQRVIHQGIELPDLPARIRIEADTAFEAVTWPMGGILIESKVMFYDCKQKILDYLIQTGRYELDTLTQDHTLLVKVMTSKEPLTVAGGGCHEIVERKFYMPVGYYLDSLGYWRNPEREDMPSLEAKTELRDTLPASNAHRQ